jgi:hypothetical protein
MEKITHAAITELLELDSTPKVTIYGPLELGSAPPHITENQIRFKNLVRSAIEQLKAKGDTSKLSRDLEDMLSSNYDNLEFWKDNGRALLICAAPGMARLFQLPIASEEYVSVDDGFHLAPVLALLEDAKEFYILTLAQQNPKLYKGDMYGLMEIDAGLPRSLREGLGIDEPNQKSESQGSATGLSTRTGWFNGRGGSRDPMDNDRLKFFHMIDARLMEKTDRSLPLLLAGIDAEIAEYRSISKYPKLMEGFIAGNHTECQPTELFEKAQAIVHSELIQPEHDAAREEYERLSGANPDRVAHDKDSIMTAAEQGRIDKLLTQFSRNTTDTVTDRVASVLRISFPAEEMSQTLNKLAAAVWAQSGKVISLLPDEMPNGAPMVARLRY